MPLNFLRRSAFKEPFERFSKIVARFFDAIALARNVEFGAEGDESVVFGLDDRSESF